MTITLNQRIEGSAARLIQFRDAKELLEEELRTEQKFLRGLFDLANIRTYKLAGGEKLTAVDVGAKAQYSALRLRLALGWFRRRALYRALTRVEVDGKALEAAHRIKVVSDKVMAAAKDGQRDPYSYIRVTKP